MSERRSKMTLRERFRRRRERKAAIVAQGSIPAREPEEFDDKTLISIERDVLGLVSGRELDDLTLIQREQKVLSSLYALETYIKERVPSFLCGDFLIFDRGVRRLTSIAQYPIEEVPWNYEQRQEPSFHRLGTPESVIFRQRQVHEELSKDELLFSRIIRKSPSEKRVLILLVAAKKTLKTFKPVAAYRSLSKQIKELSLGRTPWISVSRIIYPNSFDLKRYSVARAQAQFKRIDEVVHLTESDLDIFREDSNRKFAWLNKYFNGLSQYRPQEDLESGYVIVYCPAIFEADEPPANFWGMFSVEALADADQAEEFLEHIIYIETCLSTAVSQIVGMLAEDRRKQVEAHARRAAVVAVMARNMSHNIGSHVLAQLTSAEQIASTSEGASASATLDDYSVSSFQSSALQSKGPNSVLREVARLNTYLQARMDFLADMATSIPIVTVPKRIYGDVVLYLRPSSRDETFEGWQTLLMDRISGSDSLKRKDIKVEVRVRNESNGDFITVTSEVPEIDPLFASPNDMLGAHALYIILENIIRNCAKHSTVRKDLKLTIDLEGKDQYWWVKIFDNLGECARKPTLVKDLNNKIANSVLVRKGGWGMLEMKIASGYLRKIPPGDIDYEQDPPLLTAVESEDGNHNLGLELFLRKPKLALMIQFGARPSTPNEAAWRSIGVDIAGNFDQALQTGGDHEFLILDDPTTEQFQDAIERRAALPIRVLTCTEDSNSGHGRLCADELASYLATNEFEIVREFLWKNNVIPTDRDAKKVTIRNGNETLQVGDNEGCIFFDNHGTHYCKEATPAELLYYEPYETKSPTGFILKNLPASGSCRNVIVDELLEAATIKVAIFDERVQRESRKICTTYPTITTTPLREILKWMNIYIPEAVDLDKRQFDADDRAKLRSEWQTLSNFCSFLVIHLGVIEKVLGTTEESRIRDWIREWNDRFPSQHLIVTSGRGRPSNLPENTRFLHYSLISRYVLDERSKYHLAKVLYASRRMPK